MKIIYCETRKFISETFSKEHELINNYNSLDLKVPGRERPDNTTGWIRFVVNLQKRHKISNSESSISSSWSANADVNPKRSQSWAILGILEGPPPYVKVPEFGKRIDRQPSQEVKTTITMNDTVEWKVVDRFSQVHQIRSSQWSSWPVGHPLATWKEKIQSLSSMAQEMIDQGRITAEDHPMMTAAIKLALKQPRYHHLMISL